MNPGPQSESTTGDVYFYPPEYYVFDNFSSFQVKFRGKLYPTSEHAYQASIFLETDPNLSEKIRNMCSAHDAMKMAQENEAKYPIDWDKKKLLIMKEILQCKVTQHKYVLKKLIQSGNRKIIEDSWRDNYWGWGKNQRGKNMLGKAWMEVRKELKEQGKI